MKKRWAAMLTAAIGVVLCLCLFCGCESVEVEEKPFYTLEEAYHYGWLKKSDLKSIARLYNNREPIDNAELDSETTLAIKEAYCDSHNSKGYSNTITVEQVGFAYYGWYHDCAVIRIYYYNMPVADVVWDETVGGVTMHHTDGLGLSVWRQQEL